MEGPVNFSADLTAKGKSADEVKRSLNGDLSFNGENPMLYNIDIEALNLSWVHKVIMQEPSGLSIIT